MSYLAIYYDTRKKKKIRQHMLQYLLLRIEHFIRLEIMKYLDTSVRAWPKLTSDIITDVIKAESIFHRCPDITHQCPKHRLSILKRQMSWTLRRNARDIDIQCPDIVDQWIVFSFRLDICQQCPNINHRYLLFSMYNSISNLRFLKFYHVSQVIPSLKQQGNKKTFLHFSSTL